MDDTSDIRRGMIASGQPQRDLQEAEQTWDRDELRRDFEVLAFSAPFVMVRRNSDGALGSLEFTHSPRVYFNWEPHKED